MLISAESSDNLKRGIWLNNFMFTYFQIRPNVSISTVDQKYMALVEKYVGPEIEKFMQTTLKQLREQSGDYGYFSTKLTDIHLRATTVDGIEPGGNMTYVYFFGAIGFSSWLSPASIYEPIHSAVRRAEPRKLVAKNAGVAAWSDDWTVPR